MFIINTLFQSIYRKKPGYLKKSDLLYESVTTTAPTLVEGEFNSPRKSTGSSN